MASPLLGKLQSGKHKSLFESNPFFAVYSTGFDTLDAINAFKMDYMGKDGNIHSDIVKGLIGGRFVTIVGTSGTGKSTLADQIAWNIVKPFKNGLMMHVDAEQTVLDQRLYQTIGVDINNEDDISRIIINKDATYVEDILMVVNDICAAKEVLGKDAMYEVDGKWWGLKKVWVYEPTVIIIDALPSFVSKNTDTTAVDGQMTTNREVAVVAQFYTKLLAKMNKYNITIIATNHIRPKIVVDVYNAPPPQLMILKQSETLPRGQAPIYYASTIFRLNAAGRSSMFTEDEYGFEGFECVAQAAKSKTAYIGGSCRMIFRDDRGFDKSYTLLATAYDNNLVEGRNPYLYMTGKPEYKFSRKEFGKKYETDPEFKAAIDEVLQPVLVHKIESKIQSPDRLHNVDTNVDLTKEIAAE